MTFQTRQNYRDTGKSGHRGLGERERDELAEQRGFLGH